MFKHFLSKPKRHSRRIVTARIFAIGLGLPTLLLATATAQTNRDALLAAKPLAEVKVQPLAKPQQAEYDPFNPLVMYQTEQEDTLSFYVRTQDGEWQISPQVDANDPWVRLLVLGPDRPTIVDVAIDISGRPFRAAREEWIDKLINKAKATFLVRAGEAAADSAGIEAAEILGSTPETSSDEAELQGKAGSQEEAGLQEEAGSLEEADGETTDGETTDEETTEGENAEGENAEASESEPANETENALAEEVGDDLDVPMVKAQSRQASSLFKRLVNYLAVDQSEAEREEVRWLLAEWTGGPAQLTLSPAFAWRRADTAPLWGTLDVNGDNALDANEINNVTETLKQADINRDEIISLSELTRADSHASDKRQTNGYPLVVVIDELTDWNALRKYLRQAYPQNSSESSNRPLLERIANGDRSIAKAAMVNLNSLPAHVVYRVTFANELAKVQLLSVGVGQEKNPSSDWTLHLAGQHVITVASSSSHVELTAAQGEINQENSSGDMQQTQVAIGAAVDGYPLLRLIDHDNNHQLTRREQNSITEMLNQLDRDQDGKVEVAELPAPIRLTVTHGPFAHQQLATAVAAQHTDQTEVAIAEVPSWFTGMDRNRDGDLSRREFQGSPQQFKKFDQDQDGLISAAEIIATETKK